MAVSRVGGLSDPSICAGYAALPAANRICGFASGHGIARDRTRARPEQQGSKTLVARASVDL